ncbi:MAG: DNA-binding protein WhiA [Oscillospiraceae bacterium]|jgi:DNA-binding protein WhiA|nr:DNA-binding protein WhiA [Oscillospiraceae bacterium]
MSFSGKVKLKLSGVRETGKVYKNAYNYGLSYGLKKTGPVDSVIDASVYSSDDEIAGIFLRGVFVSCGHVTAPDKRYHLELVLPSADKCSELLDYMNERGINMKISERKGKKFIYSKNSEQIADFLAYIGASRHSMEVMNAKILKEVRNNVNRAVNCEAANIEKTAKAAGKRLADIEYVFRVKGKDFLPKELSETAVARLNNIGMSLKEIGESLEPKISKSGVNHRFKRISEIAEKLREAEKVETNP